jgi:mycofactocin system FadH/OYE family oxidoreductase 2
MSGPARYRRLFSPLRVGSLTLRNRIVFAAHLTNYADGGLPSAQHAAYYAARAAGGAGLIITEEHSVHPGDRPQEKLIQGYRPAAVPGYRRLTAAVHAHGVPVLAQLNHNGGQSSGLYSRQPAWAPSPVPDPLFREVPAAVGTRELAELVAGYELAAGHCAAGGFDGVELQCSQSSIIRGFLSRAANTRTDAYGGPVGHRARLLLEIIAAVRAVIGPALVLGIRICGDELIEDGSTLDEAVAVAALAGATGLIDYISTAIGVATATMPAIAPGMTVPAGYAMYIPAAIRPAVPVPVIGTGRITDPQQAEQALAAGHCDLVGIVRGQIADPGFAAKALAGRPAAIRTCLGCNQECAGRVGLNRWLGCIQNPRAGRESVPLAPPRRAGRRVYVVGGGPGGLQAAITAARRGHRVTLFERAPRTGGQVTVAASAPGRAGFGVLAANLAREAAGLGVDLRTGHEVDAAFLLRAAPDAVILATGSRPARPPWGHGHPRVIDVRDVLDGRHQPAGTVVVVDELGFHPATSTAELLADRGCTVEMITSGMLIGQDLGLTLDLETWNVRASARGIRQRTDLVIQNARPAGAGTGRGGPGGDRPLVLDLLHHPTGSTTQLSCDWVACAIPPQPADELWHALAGAPFERHRVGDCRAPRRAHAAVIEGDRAGAAL